MHFTRISAALVLACAASSASAALSVYQGTILDDSGANNVVDPMGIFGARMAVFSTTGGAFYDDSSGGAGGNLQNFGVNQSMGLFAGRDIRISSSVLDLPNGNQLITISCFPADAAPFVPVGSMVAGNFINALQFDIGTPNAPANPIDFDAPISIVSAVFTVSSASSTFGPFNAAATTPGGNGLTLRAGVASGTDITPIGLNRFDITVEVATIPAPSAVACLGLGGLALLRRRR